MRRPGLVLAAVVLTVAAAVGVSAATAGAEPGPIAPDPRPVGTMHPLGMPGFYGMALDEEHGHLFLTRGGQWDCGCPADDQLVVADFGGRVVARIGGLPEARGIALSADRDRLYVALDQQGQLALAEVDTAALRVVRVHPAVTGYPDNVVLAGGRLWANLVWPAGSGGYDGHLSSWDPDRPEEPWVPSGVRTYESRLLASAGEDATYLVATKTMLSDDTRWAYRVEGTRLTEVGRSEFQGGAYVRDLLVDPAERTVVSITNPPETVSRWTLPGIDDQDVLAYPTYGKAGGFDGQGRWLVAGGYEVGRPPPVRAYDTTTGRTLDLGTANVADRGIAVTSGATKVFVVVSDPYNGDPSLRILAGPAVTYRPAPRVPVTR